MLMNDPREQISAPHQRAPCSAGGGREKERETKEGGEEEKERQEGRKKTDIKAGDVRSEQWTKRQITK